MGHRNRTRSRKALLLVAALTGALALAVAQPASAVTDVTATIEVTATADLGVLNKPSSYVNLSRSSFLAQPPEGGPQPANTLSQLQSYPIDTTRVFVTPNEFHDYPTGQYDLAVSYPYLAEASSFSERILLCLNPLWQSAYLQPGALATPQEYEEVVRTALLDYKARYPKIEFIEPWNEPNHANNGPITAEQYYAYYKATYRAVNSVNAALDPSIPLKVGGPATAGFNGSYIAAFLDAYVADADAGKKLDFVSYHEYGLRSGPKRAETQKSQVAAWLSNRALNPAIPVYVTEYGLYPGTDAGLANGATPQEDLAEDQLVQAAGMASAGRYYAISGMDMPFQWVVNHSTNDRKDMFVDGLDGVPTPYGHMVTMQSKLKSQRVSTTIQSGVNTNGVGLAAISSADASGVAVMYWNYQGESGTTAYNARITVNSLPSSFAGKRIRIQRYLVDSTHSNYLYSPSQTTLQLVEDLTVTGTSLTKTPGLEPNAVGLMILTPVP